MVDGEDVRNYKLEELGSKIGYISQRPVLFSGTIAENISMGVSSGNKPTEEQIDKAISVSQARFIKSFENGKEHLLVQGGKNVSGGQKQRLSIARALARDPEILIFDDSFSALDYKTDKALRKALKKEFSATTCLIVAQRIGTIKDADKIVVLDSGRIVGQGKHEELLETCEIYREIALSQLNKEELK